MSFQKQIVVDKIELVQSGAVQVRTKTTIMEDGQAISENFHRHIVAPGDDYSAEDSRVQAICEAAHTADVISAYQAAQATKGI